MLPRARHHDARHRAAKDILKGTADPLNSAFHLGYNMLLNLLR